MSRVKNDALSLLIEDHNEVKRLFKEFEDLSDRAKVSKKKLADSICQALTIHAQIEEEIFYPRVREALPDEEDLLDEAQVEHASAKQLIAEIEAAEAGDDLYDAKVKVLSEQIEHHVMEEEGELFPKVRKSGLDLVALGEELQERKAELEKGLVARVADAITGNKTTQNSPRTNR